MPRSKRAASRGHPCDSAPALQLPEFKSYEQDLIVGASLQVSVPAGQYDDTKLVNIGAHRWFFKPELGVSKAPGQWTLQRSVLRGQSGCDGAHFDSCVASRRAVAENVRAAAARGQPA